MIRLKFDKNIEAPNIYNRLITTPKLPLREDAMSYTCKVSKNVLELQLDAPLEENTTYTFNFRKSAICDTYEVTPAENITLTFSTGPELDNIYIKGSVKSLMTAKSISGALVTLYKLGENEENDEEHAHILNTQPDYFTESKEDGTFVLEHIKAGKYRICAGKSNENKFIIDPGKEMYGFIAKPLELTEPIENITLHILQADINKLQVQSTRPIGLYFEIYFSKPIKHYKLALKHIPKKLKSATLYSHLIDNNTTIRVYNTFGLLDDDRLQAELIAEDEAGNRLQQGIDLMFKNTQGAIERLKYTIHPKDNSPMPSNRFHTELTFNKPIQKLAKPDNLWLETTASEKLYIKQDDVNIQDNVVTITKDISVLNRDNDDKLTLHVDGGAFISVEKDGNEAKKHKYGIQNLEEASSIKGTVSIKAPHFIIQLLNEAYTVLEERSNQKAYTFTNLLPGTYSIRVLVTSASGKWSCGNINNLTPPDPVIFYNGPLQLTEKWDFENIDIYDFEPFELPTHERPPEPYSKIANNQYSSFM